MLMPQPGGYLLGPLDVDDVTTLGVPAGYILSEDDRALARPVAEFASRIGLTPVLVSGGHESMLNQLICSSAGLTSGIGNEAGRVDRHRSDATPPGNTTARPYRAPVSASSRSTSRFRNRMSAEHSSRIFPEMRCVSGKSLLRMASS